MSRADKSRFASWSYRDWDSASDAQKNAYLDWRKGDRSAPRDVDFIEMPAHEGGGGGLPVRVRLRLRRRLLILARHGLPVVRRRDSRVGPGALRALA